MVLITSPVSFTVGDRASDASTKVDIGIGLVVLVVVTRDSVMAPATTCMVFLGKWKEGIHRALSVSR